MEEGVRALHVRTGEPGSVEKIERWLDDGCADPVTCVDAFDACIHLLKAGDPPRQLVLVGADWLSHDEFPVLQYFRRVWPGALVVLYGAAPPQLSAALTAGCVCLSPAGVAELLGRTPRQFVAGLAEYGASAGPLSAAPGAGRVPAMSRDDGVATADAAPHGARSGHVASPGAVRLLLSTAGVGRTPPA